MRGDAVRKPIRSILLVSVLASAGLAHAADAPAGTISMLTGRATAVGTSGTIRVLRENDQVFEGEVLSTGPSTYLNVVFRDNGRILLRPNTRFAIDDFEYQAPTAAGTAAPSAPPDSAVFRLIKGGFRALTGAVGKRDRADYRVRTPVATIGIRGTDWEARLCQADCLDVDPAPTDGLYTGVNEGGIGLTTADGATTEQGKGQFTFTSLATGRVEALKKAPKVLTQDPMPNPADCD
jgi:FecR protein